ncbi:MAG: hypothetical protein LBD33_02795, partial [Puniceicoccales bacterium]|nr:hypothetical protein [Puniceicoccales bacterium]
MITRSGRKYGSDAVVVSVVSASDSSQSKDSGLPEMVAAEPEIELSEIPGSSVPETPSECRALVPYVAPKAPGSTNWKALLLKCATGSLLVVGSGIVAHRSVCAIKHLLAKLKASKSAP